MNAPAREAALMRRHREMLIVAILVVLLAFLLKSGADERITVPFFPEYPLPPLCVSYSCFGVRCPGCGLTRSFVQLAHGNWEAAWQQHRLGWVLLAAVFLQFPYRLVALRNAGRSPIGSLLPKLFGTLLIVLLIGNWLANLFC